MRKILSVLSLILLASCGWEPLYVQKSSGWFSKDESINAEIAQIKVEAISERFGQQIRNNLLDAFTPKGMPKQPKYRLSVTVEDNVVTRQALREDITATRESVKYSVKYKMTDAEHEELFSGDSLAFVSYDILANPYSTTMAQKSAQNDAAKIIADDIVLRVGAYFHSRMSGKNYGDF